MFSVWKYWPHIGTLRLHGRAIARDRLFDTEQEVVTLNDVAKPFTNFEEMKAAAVTRRNIHRETAEVLKRGHQSQPTAEDRTDFDPAKAPEPPAPSGDTSTGATASVPKDALPLSKPKAKWITVPIRSGCRRVASTN